MLVSFMYLLKLTLSYFLLFYFLPALVLPAHQEYRGTLDRWVMAMIHSHFFIILIVHLLALSKLYETLSLYGAAGIAFVLLAARNIRTGAVPLGTRQLLALLDLTDNRVELQNKLMMKLAALKDRGMDALKRSIREFARSPVAWTGIVLCFLISAAIRFRHSIEYSYYAASDPYVHLKWAKAMGGNQLYIDGVYPYGFEAVIAALNKFYLLDPYYIVRFTGPLAGVLVLLMFFYVLRRSFPRDAVFILVAMGVLTASSWLFAGFIWRQMSSLSMEYGMVFFFPGIYFLVQYFRKGHSAALLLAVECMVLTLLIHAYVAVCTGAAYIIVFLLHADQAVRPLKRLLKLSVIFLTAGMVGLMPLALGLISGIEFYESSINYVIDSVNLGAGNQRSWSQLWSYYSEIPFFLVFLLSAGVLGLLTIAKLLFRKGAFRTEGLWRRNAVFLLLGGLFFCLYQASTLGLPVFVPGDRMEFFFLAFAAIIVALALSQLFAFIRWKLVSGSVKLAATCLIVAFFFSSSSSGFALPVGDRYQYEEAAQTYLEIRSKYPHQEWTIISPIEEYPIVLGYGWHTNLWEFVKGISERTGEEIRFPTNYVFLMVEKVPLGMDREVTEADAAEPFPTIEGSRLDDYYRFREKRLVIQAKAYYWAEEYRKTHSYMKVFRDSPNMRVYLITQDGSNPYNLLN